MYWIEVEMERVYARTSNAVLAVKDWSTGIAGSLQQAIEELSEEYGVPDFIQHNV